MTIENAILTLDELINKTEDEQIKDAIYKAISGLIVLEVLMPKFDYCVDGFAGLYYKRSIQIKPINEDEEHFEVIEDWYDEYLAEDIPEFDKDDYYVNPIEADHPESNEGPEYTLDSDFCDVY